MFSVGLTQNTNNNYKNKKNKTKKNNYNNFKIKCHLSKNNLITRVNRNITSKLTTTSDMSTFEVL